MKRVAVVWLTLVMLAALAVPARAHLSDVGVFEGIAFVGQSWAQPCDDQGFGRIASGSEGLHYPSPVGPGPAQVTAGWRFVTYGVRNLIHGTGLLQMCGSMIPQPATGIGAACGMSASRDGRGMLDLLGSAHPASRTYLKNVGWEATAGSVFPITGDITTQPGGRPIGLLTGVAIMEPGYFCLEEDGANSFTTLGAFALVIP